MSDPRTPAEIRYDRERDGTLYAKPAAAEDVTDDAIFILDWIDKQAALRLGSLIVTEKAYDCVSSDAVTPNIRAIPAGHTIGYDGDPDGSPTITEIWHASTAPVTIVLTDDNELWVLHRDEWSSQG